jgi:spore coat assembly protein SafA
LVKVNVNGNNFILFKQADFSESLDNIANECQLVLSESLDNDSFIKVNDLIEVYFDDIKVFTGYMESISDGESNDSHDLQYNGRSKNEDLLDSTIPDNLKTVKDVKKFKDLVQKAIDGLMINIKVVDEKNASINTDLKAGEIGQKCGDYLGEYARSCQVYLGSNGDGDIIIRKLGGKLKTMLINQPNGKQNNIKDSSININYEERYNKYIVRSHGNLISWKTNSGTQYKSVDNVGIAYDNEIRDTRILEIIADKPMTKAECENRAKEEANLRRIRSFSYQATVAGLSANGELWQSGKLVKTIDTKKGINGWLIIKSIHQQMTDGGETSTMDLTYPDAYGVVANLEDENSTTMSSTYIVVKGDSIWKIAKKKGIDFEKTKQANPQIKNKDLILPGQEINLGN